MNPSPLHYVRASGLALAVAALSALATGDSASRFGSDNGVQERQPEFDFVRLVYSTDPGYGRRRGSWSTDYPEAEYFLTGAIRRLTRIGIGPQGKNLPIMDDALFDHPWLYAVEVGQWSLSDEEAARLREYLLRGGFLVVDDFHGTYEWEVFAAGMRKVFPDRPIVDIPPSDPVFHVVFDIVDHVQIPGIQVAYSGQTFERDGYDPQWRGIYDDEGRLMVVINFNMDLGDAWEHADVPEYALKYSTRAYQYAINYIIYAMTH
jgi:hypothetical protein